MKKLDLIDTYIKHYTEEYMFFFCGVKGVQYWGLIAGPDMC
jgi:hypothetical protein